MAHKFLGTKVCCFLSSDGLKMKIQDIKTDYRILENYWAKIDIWNCVLITREAATLCDSVLPYYQINRRHAITIIQCWSCRMLIYSVICYQLCHNIDRQPHPQNFRLGGLSPQPQKRPGLITPYCIKLKWSFTIFLQILGMMARKLKPRWWSWTRGGPLAWKSRSRGWGRSPWKISAKMSAFEAFELNWIYKILQHNTILT